MKETKIMSVRIAADKQEQLKTIAEGYGLRLNTYLNQVFDSIIQSESDREQEALLQGERW